MNRVSNGLVVSAALVVVVAGLKAAAPLIVPFLLSIFLAIIFGSPLFWLRRRGVPAAASFGVVIAALVLAGLLVVLVVGHSVKEFSASLPHYQERLHEEFSRLTTWLATHQIVLPSDISTETFDPSIAMRLAGRMFDSLSSLLADGLLIAFTVIFILMESAGFPEKLHRALPAPQGTEAFLNRFVEDVNRYMGIKTAVSILTGLLVTLVLVFIGADFAILWGLLAFLLNYIPNIGSILAAVPAVLVVFIQLGGTSALGTILAYAVINMVMGSVIEPRLMGRSLGLSTLVVFVSLVFWGWVLGPVGMLLSVPLTMVIKIGLDSNPDTRSAGILLGSGSAADGD